MQNMRLDVESQCNVYLMITIKVNSIKIIQNQLTKIHLLGKKIYPIYLKLSND